MRGWLTVNEVRELEDLPPLDPRRACYEHELVMEIRAVHEAERVIVGVVAPYDETTYLTGDPGGERIRRGAFTGRSSIAAPRSPLLRNHDRVPQAGHLADVFRGARRAGRQFVVNPATPATRSWRTAGTATSMRCRVGFVPVRSERGATGAEMLEAKLGEVSLVARARLRRRRDARGASRQDLADAARAVPAGPT